MTEERRVGLESIIKPGPLLSSKSGSATVDSPILEQQMRRQIGHVRLELCWQILASLFTLVAASHRNIYSVPIVLLNSLDCISP